jgi:hypothetical protein
MAGTITVGELLSDPTSGNKITIGSGTTLDLAGSAGSTAMPSGSVLQVVSAPITDYTVSSSQSWIDTNASLAITPQFSSSKIVCMFTFGFVMWGANRIRGGFKLLRGSTIISGGSTETMHFNQFASGGESIVPVALNCVDAPGTTNPTTYKIQIYAHTAGMSCQVIGETNTRPAHMILMEIAG